MQVLDKFIKAREELNSRLIEREDEVDLALTALVAGEHLLLVGPPGTAKSMLLTSLARFAGGNVFNWLMTKFTTPEEVFGMYDLTKLRVGDYVRKTKNKLPEADLAFLDEIFKSSSAILNTTLRILNEGTFDTGAGEIKTPLKLCVAASNEWPSEENGQKELSALFDRFLIRKEVSPVKSSSGRKALLFAKDEDLLPQFPAPLGGRELSDARKQAQSIPPSKEFEDAIMTCLDKLRAEGIVPGDRRIRKASKVAQANAWLAGSSTIEPEHGEILAHVLWDDPIEQPRKVRDVVGECMNPTGHSVSKLLAEAEEIVKSTDSRDIASGIASSKKLKEVITQLKKLGSNTRATSALSWVQNEATQIKLRITES